MPLSEFTFKTIEEKKAHLRGLMRMPSIQAKLYDEREEYDRLDFIKHPNYGVGLVEDILSDDYITVFFLESEKQHKLPQRTLRHSSPHPRFYSPPEKNSAL